MQHKIYEFKKKKINNQLPFKFGALWLFLTLKK